MRFLRKLIGLGMVMIGLPARLVGGAGWLAAGHRDPNGAFTAAQVPRYPDRPDDFRALPSSHDLTGELVPVRAFEFDEFESVLVRDGVEDEMSDVVERDEQSKEGIARRFGNLLRGRSGPPGRHVAPSTVDGSTVEESSGQAPTSPRDRFEGESPYIYTAT
jgi:hypothetical protein